MEWNGMRIGKEKGLMDIKVDKEGKEGAGTNIR